PWIDCSKPTGSDSVPLTKERSPRGKVRHPPARACCRGSENSACCAGAGLPRALTIRNGPESYPDCNMLEVNPLADVPKANLLRVCKRLQPGCKPTDAEDSTDDGNRNYAFI